MVRIVFIKDDVEKEVDAETGSSLLEVAEKNDIELVGNCGGACVCGSCHVYIDEKWLNMVDEATEEEEDVLDIVFNPKSNSRLACQVFVKPEMDGMRVTIA